MNFFLLPTILIFFLSKIFWQNNLDKYHCFDLPFPGSSLVSPSPTVLILVSQMLSGLSISQLVSLGFIQYLLHLKNLKMRATLFTEKSYGNPLWEEKTNKQTFRQHHLKAVLCQGYRNSPFWNLRVHSQIQREKERVQAMRLRTPTMAVRQSSGFSV